MTPGALRDALRSPVRAKPSTMLIVLAVVLVLIVSLVGLRRLANPAAPAPTPTPTTFQDENAACDSMWRDHYTQWQSAHPAEPVQTVQHATMDYLAQHGCGWFVGRN